MMGMFLEILQWLLHFGEMLHSVDYFWQSLVAQEKVNQADPENIIDISSIVTCHFHVTLLRRNCINNSQYDQDMQNTLVMRIYNICQIQQSIKVQTQLHTQGNEIFKISESR